jgi:hypothetical protein
MKWKTEQCGESPHHLRLNEGRVRMECETLEPCSPTIPPQLVGPSQVRTRVNKPLVPDVVISSFRWYIIFFVVC